MLLEMKTSREEEDSLPSNLESYDLCTALLRT